MQKDAAMEKFERALDHVAPREHMSNWREIREYLKGQAGPKANANSLLAQRIAGTTDKKHADYKAALRNVQRWDKGRSPGKDLQAKLNEIGKKLPDKGRKVPRKFTIKVRGKFNPSPKRGKNAGPERERDIELDFSGADALDFANDPDPEIFFEMFGVDGEMFVDMMDDSATVTAYE